jgi:hypothetical protein
MGKFTVYQSNKGMTSPKVRSLQPSRERMPASRTNGKVVER